MTKHGLRHPVAARKVADELGERVIPEHFGKLRLAVQQAVLAAIRDRDYYWSRRCEAADAEIAGEKS